MQILILGNGFDIEHKLPTQYKDFLGFIREYLDLYKTEKIEDDCREESIYVRNLYQRDFKTPMYLEIKCTLLNDRCI